MTYIAKCFLAYETWKESLKNSGFDGIQTHDKMLFSFWNVKRRKPMKYWGRQLMECKAYILAFMRFKPMTSNKKYSISSNIKREPWKFRLWWDSNPWQNQKRKPLKYLRRELVECQRRKPTTFWCSRDSNPNLQQKTPFINYQKRKLYKFRIWWDSNPWQNIFQLPTYQRRKPTKH